MNALLRFRDATFSFTTSVVQAINSIRDTFITFQMETRFAFRNTIILRARSSDALLWSGNTSLGSCAVVLVTRIKSRIRNASTITKDEMRRTLLIKTSVLSTEARLGS